MLRYTLLLLALSVSLCQADNPVSAPILNGRTVSVRKFAKIPDFSGRASRLISTVNFKGDLYVCTSSSGGLIYKVTKSGSVSLFFNVAAAMAADGNPMDITNLQHGGLRSVAFHPRFKKNGLFYVSVMQKRNRPISSLRYLSRPSSGLIPADSVVLEFKFDKNQGKVLPGSLRVVIRIGMPVYDHPVKQIAFKGKFLYIAHGDGSVQSAVAGGGQRNDGLGKIIRINPKSKGSNPYKIPRSNPFRNNNQWLDELYAVGFRNPHNICFSKNGELFVTDAGRDNVEEINIVKAGGNYGWSKREGTFVHKTSGGIVNGVDPLPGNDASFGFEYPVAQVGHEGPRGAGFVGQALAGSCPIENGSAMSGTMLYMNFPTDGNLYYSFLSEMRNAKTSGPPSQLTQAKTYKTKILYDHDRNTNTPPLQMDNFRDIIRTDKSGTTRSDLRFGQGPAGEIYVTSKQTGWLYLITSTVP